ncbi:MAG: thiol oxidoreductase [Flavobacteriales bacterium]|nr:thiol oxidoreductase [Flavobacteriales bacterium]
MKQKIFVISAIAALVTLVVRCSNSTTQVFDHRELLPGGALNTVSDKSVNAFGLASPALEGEQELKFFVGNSFFNQNWVSAPASTTARDGLGPTFNAHSCSGCHFKDGRGRPPALEGEKGTGLLLRLSKGKNGDEALAHYGMQLQDQAIQGVAVEAELVIDYKRYKDRYEDGSTFELEVPTYRLQNGAFGDFPADLAISPRVAQQMIGLGLLETIPESRLDELSDPDDANGDGISGRKNMVWNALEDQYTVGRFGWKANQPTVAQQVAGAFGGDMGITTPIFPDEHCPGNQLDCANAETGGEPEISQDDFDKVVLYSSNLAVPAPRNAQDPLVMEGKALFNEIGCAGCHVPSHPTGENAEFSHLSNQTIWPYTDLLLHDMGPELADNRPDFEATGKEWRTQPLWGLGLIETVNGHTRLLHDGRARSIEEAILWHGGEAEESLQAFKQLGAEDREKVLVFLRSL